jgi:hypothetical protein
MKNVPVVAERRTSLQSQLAALLMAALCLSPALPAMGKVSISVKDGYRTIESDGMPEHPTGEFPNDHNPNTISAQAHKYRVPAEPHPAETTTALGMWPFGVAINGIPFDPFAAEWWRRNPRSGWQYEPMFAKLLGIDENNAHVQPDGSYHYHGIPNYLVQHNGGKSKPALVGYAADGFPIYGPYGYKDAKDSSSGLVKLKSSYRLKEGERPDGPGGKFDGHFVQDFEYVAGLGDLDECNGRNGVTPEYPNGTYYYVLTEAYPYIPRIFRGKPDQSFLRTPPPGGPGGRNGRMGPPRGGRNMGPLVQADGAGQQERGFPGFMPGMARDAKSAQRSARLGMDQQQGEHGRPPFGPPPGGDEPSNEQGSDLNRPGPPRGMRGVHMGPPPGMPDMGADVQQGEHGQGPGQSAARGNRRPPFSPEDSDEQDGSGPGPRQMSARGEGRRGTGTGRQDMERSAQGGQACPQGPPPGMDGEMPPPPPGNEAGQMPLPDEAD